MKKAGYFLILALLILHSCKKDFLKEDSFDRYDNFSQLTVDSVDYILDVRDGDAFSSSYIADTLSNNDSIWLCIGLRLSDRHDYTYSGLFGFYLMTKLAVKNLELEPDPLYVNYIPSINDIFRIFSPNQEFSFSKTELPWMTYPNTLGTGVVFTWGISEQFRSTLYEPLSYQNESSCMVVRSEIHDSESIKVELDFDIYLKHQELDNTVHIKSNKMIVLMYRQ